MEVKGAWSTYIVALLGLPKADILRGHAQDIAFGVDDTSSSTAGADIDADIVLHVWVQFVVGISGQLTRGLPVRLSKRQGRHSE